MAAAVEGSYNTILALLNGVIDGVNKTFTTSQKYVATTLRLVWNGQVYESDDDNYGWVEIDDGTIETTNAPLIGDVLQAIYLDKESEFLGETANVVGSPFHPSGVLP